MLFITDTPNCIKVRCGNYTVSLSKQGSWYNCIIDNKTSNMVWEDCKELTGVVFKIVNPHMEWGRDSEWVVSDYIELSKILKVIEGIDDIINKHIKRGEHSSCPMP